MWLLIVGSVVAIGVQLLGVRLFRYLDILDKPGPDVPKRDSVPTMQGLFAIIAVIVGLVVSGKGALMTDSTFVGMWLGLFIVLLVSFVDELGYLVDRRLSIHAGVRFAIQIITICLVGRVSYDVLFPITLFGFELEGLLGYGFLIVRFCLFINAINWLDGVYGLSTGTTSVGFWTLVALVGVVVIPAFPEMSPERFGLLSDASWIAVLFGVVTLVGAWIEFKPMGVMRDLGTMTFGFALAYLSLAGGAKIGTLIVVLALPLMDAAWVVLDRVLRRGVSPMKGDYSHLHFRLMAMGWNRTEVRVAIWVASICLGVLMILQGTDSVNKVIIFVMAGLLFFGVNGYLFWVKGLESEYSREMGQEKQNAECRVQSMAKVGAVINRPSVHTQEDDVVVSSQNRYNLMKKTHAMIVALKELKRTGWVQLGVKESESVADHVFGVSVLSLIDSLQESDLDTGKVVQIALVHDLVESVVGDIMTVGENTMSKQEKDELERKAAKELLDDLDPTGYLLNLYLEYQDRSTAEGDYVKQLDKFDTLLQAREYSSRRGSDVVDPEAFVRSVEKVVNDERLLDLLKRIEEED